MSRQQIFTRIPSPSVIDNAWQKGKRALTLQRLRGADLRQALVIAGLIRPAGDGLGLRELARTPSAPVGVSNEQPDDDTAGALARKLQTS